MTATHRLTQPGCGHRRRYTEAVSTLVDSLARALECEPSVELAVLFGSVARGQARDGSDLDVGVIGVDAHELSDLQVTLERATGRRIDLVSLADAPPLLRFEIARDGRVLLERAPFVWSDFKARAMVDWWDWAPTARLFHHAAVSRLRAEAPRGPA